RVADERGATLIDASANARCEAELVDGRARLTIETPHATYGPVALGLRGEHQIGNALVAVRLLEAAAAAGTRIDRAAIERGLARAEWPARLELVTIDGDRRVLLDAAHNPEGARALAAYLRRWHSERPPLGGGGRRDKNVAQPSPSCAPPVRRFLAAPPPPPRARPADDLAAHLREAGAIDVL